MIRFAEIGNFKCFGSAKIEMGSLTLLTGLNGSGKTSFSQSILLLRQSSEQGVLQRGNLALNGDLVQLGAGHDVFFEDADDAEDVIRIGLTWRDDEKLQCSFAYDRNSDVLTAKQIEISKCVLDRPPIGGSMFYLASERIGPRVSYAMSDFLVEHRGQIGTRGELAPHYLAKFGQTRIDTPALFHPSAATEYFQDQVEAWLGEISPGTRVSVESHRALDAVQLQFAFAGPHGRSNDYRPTNVGFGLTYALPIVAAALASRPGALLVVENPEAHLHPRGQVKITQLLVRAACSGVQVLIETHSDHVLNAIRMAVHDGEILSDDVRIHYFERRMTSERVYHSIVSPRVDPDGRLDAWPDGFFDEMEKSLEHLLSPRKVNSES